MIIMHCSDLLRMLGQQQPDRGTLTLIARGGSSTRTAPPLSACDRRVRRIGDATGGPGRRRLRADRGVPSLTFAGSDVAKADRNRRRRLLHTPLAIARVLRYKTAFKFYNAIVATGDVC